MIKKYAVFILVCSIVIGAFSYILLNEKQYSNISINDQNDIIIINNTDSMLSIGSFISGPIDVYDGNYEPVDFLDNSLLGKKKTSYIPDVILPDSKETTIRMKIDLQGFDKDIAIRLPMLGHGFRLYQNDTLIGEVIDDRAIESKNVKDTYIYEKIFVLRQVDEPFYLTISINTVADTLTLRDTIYIGSIESVIEKRFLFHTLDYILIGGLLITSIFTMLLYIVMRNKGIDDESKLLLYICISTTALAMRALLATDLANSICYSIVGMRMTIRLFNVTSDVAFIGAILYLSDLYSDIGDKRISRFLVIAYACIGVIECFVLHLFVAYFVNLFNVFAFVYCIYIIYRGYLNSEKNKLLSFGMLLSVILVLYDILYYLIICNGNYAVKVFSYSSISVYLFIIPACVLAGIKYVESFNEKKRLYDKNQMISRELMNINSSIDHMVLDRTKELQNSMSEIQEAYKKVEELSNTDPLTNLSNRRHFMQMLKLLYENNNKKFTIVIGDIDDFKVINDIYGHNFGDNILKKIGVVLQKHAKVVARWGGEEFIVCINSSNKMTIDSTLNKMMKEIRDLKFIHEDDVINISMTFGVYLNSDYQNLIKSINNADISLYHGKDTGKNKVSYYSEM